MPDYFSKIRNKKEIKRNKDGLMPKSKESSNQSSYTQIMPLQEALRNQATQQLAYTQVMQLQKTVGNKATKEILEEILDDQASPVYSNINANFGKRGTVDPPIDDQASPVYSNINANFGKRGTVDPPIDDQASPVYSNININSGKRGTVDPPINDQASPVYSNINANFGKRGTVNPPIEDQASPVDTNLNVNFGKKETMNLPIEDQASPVDPIKTGKRRIGDYSVLTLDSGATVNIGDMGKGIKKNQNVTTRKNAKGKDEIIKSHHLGKGGLSKVVRGMMHTKDSNETPVAIKKIIRGDDGLLVDDSERREESLDIQEKLNHKNILRSFGHVLAPSHTQEEQMYSVQELASGGDLEGFINNSMKKLSPEEKNAFQAHTSFGMLQGLKHMHDSGYVHKDIKPANFFLGSDGTPKIADFDTASTEDDHGISGSYKYYSPSAQDIDKDLQKGSLSTDSPAYEERSKRVDMKLNDTYAMGLSLLEMAKGKSMSMREIAFSQKQSMALKSTLDNSKQSGADKLSLKDIALLMMHPDEAKRLTIDEALKLPYFKRYQNDPEIPEKAKEAFKKARGNP